METHPEHPQANAGANELFQKILAPVDFSAASRKALEYAVLLARARNGQITLLYVVEPPVFPEWGYAHLVIRDEKLRDNALEKLEEWKHEFGDLARLISKVMVRIGEAEQQIVKAAREEQAGVIVLSSHGLGLKHAVLGSTVERVVRHAHCPVLTFRERVLDDSAAGPMLHPARLLVPIDFSDHSKRALAQAIELARQQPGSRVQLLHVVPATLPADLRHVGMALEEKQREAEAKKFLEEFAASEVPAAVRGEILLRSGGPYYEINQAAEDLRADLIVLSTHGHSGWKHLVLGSTAERVVRHASCPVLVVRGQANAEEQSVLGG